MLRLAAPVHAAMIGHAYDGLPDEACGLLLGQLDVSAVDAFVPCRNVDASSRTYGIGPDGWRAADEVADRLGIEVLGVMHSHTHTDAYPSPTDIEKADNPLLAGWHYLIVSLRDDAPVLRSYVIDGNTVSEEGVAITGR